MASPITLGMETLVNILPTMKTPEPDVISEFYQIFKDRSFKSYSKYLRKLTKTESPPI